MSVESLGCQWTFQRRVHLSIYTWVSASQSPFRRFSNALFVSTNTPFPVWIPVLILVYLTDKIMSIFTLSHLSPLPSPLSPPLSPQSLTLSVSLKGSLRMTSGSGMYLKSVWPMRSACSLFVQWDQGQLPSIATSSHWRTMRAKVKRTSTVLGLRERGDMNEMGSTLPEMGRWVMWVMREITNLHHLAKLHLCEVVFSRRYTIFLFIHMYNDTHTYSNISS